MGGNFKVRALKTDSPFFYKGDVIEFKNGRCRWSDGGDSNKYENFEDLIDDNGWTDYLEEIKESSDLRELIKPCYVVKHIDDELSKVEIDDVGELIISGENHWCNVSNLSKELNGYRGDSSVTIKEIFGYSSYNKHAYKISTEGRKSIWKREEVPIKSPTELEIESIEEEQRKLADRLAKLKERL